MKDESNEELSGDQEKTQKSKHQQRKESLPKGQAFTVMLAKEAVGKQLICLRSPFQAFKWEGDWRLDSDNKNWDSKTKAAIGIEYFDAPGSEDQN